MLRTPNASNWLNHTCCTTALLRCKLHCCSLGCYMMDDSLMTTPELMAHQQVLETFKGLAPLLGQAQLAQLASNPREQKRSKHQHEPPQQTQQDPDASVGGLADTTTSAGNTGPSACPTGSAPRSRPQSEQKGGRYHSLEQRW